METGNCASECFFFFFLKESTIIKIGEKMLFSLFEERVPPKIIFLLKHGVNFN